MKKRERAPQKITINESYESLGVDHLLIFCVKRVSDSGEECTLERLVFECFTLFPKKFGLARYPQWPDSTRVYRSWRRCRLDNGWLTGSPQEGFRLTAKGEEVAVMVGTKLNMPASNSRRPRETSKTRGKEEAVVRYLRKSDAFRRWAGSPTHLDISESELRSLLNATFETPQEVLRENLDYYRENAKLVNDKEVLAFLGACQERLENVMRRR